MSHPASPPHHPLQPAPGRRGAVEVTCWVVSGLIVAGLVWALLSGLLHPPPSRTPDGTAAMRAAAAPDPAAPAARPFQPLPAAKRPPAPPPADERHQPDEHDERYEAEAEPPHGPAAVPNSEYDGDFMLLGSDPEAPAQQSDTSDMFEDSGAGREAFPQMDRRKMMAASNTRPGMTAEMDTGSATRVPSRLLGHSTIAWRQLVEPPPLVLSAEGVPFGGSSYSDAARAEAAGFGM